MERTENIAMSDSAFLTSKQKVRFSPVNGYFGYAEPDKYLAHITMIGEDGVSRTLNTIDHFEKKLFTKAKQGFSPLVIIAGLQGIGKSMLALYICIKFMRLLGKGFDFRGNSFYDVLSAVRRIGEKEREAFIIDEAGDLLNAKEWYAKSHIAVTSMVNTQRFRQNLYVFVSPFTSDVDRSILKHFDFQIHVTAHGRFKTFKFYKRFVAADPRKSFVPIFLDDMGIKLSEVDAGIFDEYTKFSIDEKKKILERRCKQLEMHTEREEYVYNYIKRLRDKYA